MQPRSSRLNFAALLLAAACLASITGCGDKESPEQQVRAVIAAAETAAEARDTSAVMDLIADSYSDADGRSRIELERMLRGYFIVHQSVQLLTRINRLELPTADEASVDLSVGMLGRESNGADDWNLAADIQNFDLVLRLEDGEWRVTHARRRR